jgi:hypothetical protein
MKNVRVLFKPSRFRNTVESILRQRRERPPALARPEDVLNASLQASVSVLAIWLPLRYSLEVENFRLLRKDEKKKFPFFKTWFLFVLSKSPYRWGGKVLIFLTLIRVYYRFLFLGKEY